LESEKRWRDNKPFGDTNIWSRNPLPLGLGYLPDLDRLPDFPTPLCCPPNPTPPGCGLGRRGFGSPPIAGRRPTPSSCRLHRLSFDPLPLNFPRLYTFAFAAINQLGSKMDVINIRCTLQVQYVLSFIPLDGGDTSCVSPLFVFFFV
jgi:hypothetical protein